MAEKMVFTNDPASLKQLIGWHIDDAIMDVPRATVILIISQLTAENKQRLIITPHVTATMMGNITVHNPGIQISAEPVVDQPSGE